jgi:hypothetical protein
MPRCQHPRKSDEKIAVCGPIHAERVVVFIGPLQQLGSLYSKPHNPLPAEENRPCSFNRHEGFTDPPSAF